MREMNLQQVEERKDEQNIEWEDAMDEIRVDNLVRHCCDIESAMLYLLKQWNYEPQVKLMNLHTYTKIDYKFLINIRRCRFFAFSRFF